MIIQIRPDPAAPEHQGPGPALPEVFRIEQDGPAGRPVDDDWRYATSPVAIPFPDPEALNRARERRARGQRLLEVARDLAEADRRAAIAKTADAAWRNGTEHGHQRGYVEGWHIGLGHGALAGVCATSVGFALGRFIGWL